MLRETLADLTAAMHLAYFAIAIVLMENSGGNACPLNTVEWGLRASATGAQEASSGTGYVLDRLLFHVIGGRVLNDTLAGLRRAGRPADVRRAASTPRAAGRALCELTAAAFLPDPDWLLPGR